MSASSANSPGSSGPGTSPPRFRTCRCRTTMPSRCGGSRRGGRTGRSRPNIASLLWGDVVEADFGRSDWVRVPRGIGAFADFILSGTAWRYFAVNWRYGLFFAYPILIFASFVAAADRGRLSSACGSACRCRILFAPLIAFAVFAGLLIVPGALRDAALHVRRLDLRAGTGPPDAAGPRCAAAGLRRGSRETPPAGRL